MIQTSLGTAALIWMASELFQEERDADGLADVTKLSKPLGISGSATRLAFTTGDHPMDAGQIDSSQRSK